MAPSYPWPATDGYLLRASNTVQALQDVGDVDYLWLQETDRPIDERPGVNLIRLRTQHTVERGPSVREWFGPLPRRLQRLGPIDLGPVRDQIAGPYDLVFCLNVDIWWRVQAQLPDVPTIVDFNDLLHLLRRHHGGIRRMLEGLDARKWDRLQRDAASRVSAVVVCSELDVVRCGCPNAVAAFNGYELERTPPTDRPEPPADGGTLVMVGLWSYSANADGAEWFARQVLPLIRRVRPRLTVRFVGREVDRIKSLGGIDGVELVGEVVDVGPELDRADLSIIPLLGGGGTRLKALEAFANRLPVISTSKGVEGIECTDRVDVFIGDGSDRFASAVLEALDDGELRRKLARNAAVLYEDRYRWSAIRQGVSALVRRTIDGVGVSSGAAVPDHGR